MLKLPLVSALLVLTSIIGISFALYLEHVQGLELASTLCFPTYWFDRYGIYRIDCVYSS